MKKFLSMALIAAMTLSLAACGSNSNNEADSTGADNASSDKTYVIATDTVFAPFEFSDENNNFVGIDVDILAAIAEDQGFKYELRQLLLWSPDRAMQLSLVCLSLRSEKRNMISPMLTLIPM